MPNLTKDYHAVGFDVDHCLVKYNIKEITRILIRGDLAYLHDHLKWPKEILDFDLSHNSKDIEACLCYSVFDIKNGTILKLSEGKKVVAAFKGRKLLSFNEMQALYG